MELHDKLIGYCGKKYILSKCSEKNCNLKDITREFIILDGDNIKDNQEKSVDCIIIDSRKNIDDAYRVILCELTSSSKKIDDAREKFENSGKLIVNIMKDINMPIYKIDCLLLGKIVKNGQTIPKKYLTKPVKINGYSNKNTIINQQKCGFSINELYS